MTSALNWIRGRVSLYFGGADVSALNPLPVTAVFTGGDIEIGAVEIKDGAADIRQTVLAASTAAAATDKPAVVALHPSSGLPASSAAGGISSTARLASAAASTNGTLVKASAGRIYSAQGYNAAAYPVYLVLYDAVTNPPVPGTTAIRKKIPIPAGTAFALDWPVGMSFATGIGYAFTKLAADADTTALAAGDILQFNLDYV